MADPDLRLLIDVLEVLAAGPEHQVAALPEFRQAATQLRDGVVDMVRLNEALERRGALPPAAADAVRALDACFDRMMDAGDAMFTAEAVRHAAEWREVRRIARGALARLGGSQADQA